MKIRFALLFSFPLMAFGQNCSLKKEKDPFTQQPRMATGFMKLSAGRSPVQLNLVADAKEVKLLFALGEGRCFDDQATAMFTFDSTRTKSTQRNTTAMNCDGIFSLVFRNAVTTPAALQKMATNKVAQIVIVNAAKEKWEINLTEEQKQELRQRAACIIAEAKTLIPPSS